MDGPQIGDDRPSVVELRCCDHVLIDRCPLQGVLDVCVEVARHRSFLPIDGIGYLTASDDLVVDCMPQDDPRRGIFGVGQNTVNGCIGESRDQFRLCHESVPFPLGHWPFPALPTSCGYLFM